MVRVLLQALWTLALVALAWPARAWTENRVTGDEVRVAIEPDGSATVEHRLTLRMNGNERQHAVALSGVDPDAVPLPNAYVVPESEALGNSLASAVPLKLALSEVPTVAGSVEGAAEERELRLDIDDDAGILRGAFVFVFRYRTNLLGRELLRREGAMMRVEWQGPRLGAGLDNLRVVFALPPAPTPPRAAELRDDAESSLLSEVRRSSDADEIDLVRTYAPEGARVVWTIRADPRAVPALPTPVAEAAPQPFAMTTVRALLPGRTLPALAGTVACAFAGLVWAKGRQVRRLAAEARSTMPALIPVPDPVRAVLSAAAFVAGLGCQLVLDRPVPGAIGVVLAALLAAHGAARLDPAASLRGPGRWLAVSEREALVELPRPRGAPLDLATVAGRAVFLVALAPFAAAVAVLAPRAPHHALLVGLDALVVLAVFGTGRLRALPPDLAVEPAPFFRKLVAALRKRDASESLRLVPRVRIPTGSVDADELRLLVVPRLPLRGFTSIEVAMTYAVGFGARVAMPEILLRVVAGSPCDEALAALSRHARITPGRKADERVFTLSPRLPTVAMTAEIALALAARVTDRGAVEGRTKRPPARPAVRRSPRARAA